MRCFALRRTTGVVGHVPAGVNPALAVSGYGPSDLDSAYNVPTTLGGGQDRRDRRRVRRPERRERPEHLSQQLRATRVHDRQRLLHEGEPERRDEPASGGEHRLVVGDHARPRDGLGDLPELPHPARRGQQPNHRQPRYRGQHRCLARERSQSRTATAAPSRPTSRATTRRITSTPASRSSPRPVTPDTRASIRQPRRT